MESQSSNNKISLEIQHEGYAINCYETTTEHAKEYGLIAKKPLFLKNLFVVSEKRNNGNGKKVLQMIEEYAIKHKCDLIFGHIPQNAEFSKDDETLYSTEFNDRDYIKHWLFRNGYSIQNENYDFYKVLRIEKPLRYFGGIGFSNCNEAGSYEVRTETDTKRFSKLSDAKYFYENTKGEKAIWSLDKDELIDSWFRK